MTGVPSFHSPPVPEKEFASLWLPTKKLPLFLFSQCEKGKSVNRSRSYRVGGTGGRSAPGRRRHSPSFPFRLPTGGLTAGDPVMRKIIHIDMDAFFASIEQRDRPELRGLPVIVGGSAERRGVVSTCSYEARAFGVHSAMPMRTAMRLCPEAAVLETDLDKYRRVSEEIREIFHTVTDLVEPVSIDEAYLDVTENKLHSTSATRLAREIQRQIFQQTRLTASAGVSYNKFLAKIASDMRKPAGLTVIPPDRAQAFLDALPIRKFHGIGKVTAARLTAMNVRTGHDLRQLDLATLTMLFGKVGSFYFQIVRGCDDRPVEVDEQCKSIGRELTFARDCSDVRRLRILLRSLGCRVARLQEKRGLAGRTVTVKVRYDDFRTVTRSLTLSAPESRGEAIGEIAVALAAKTEFATRPVRLLGVTVSNFPSPDELDRPVQLEFDFTGSGLPRN